MLCEHPLPQRGSDKKLLEMMLLAIKDNDFSLRTLIALLFRSAPRIAEFG